MVKISTAIRLFLSLVFIAGLDRIQAQDTSKALTITGYAEVYYLRNFNNPLNNTQPSFLYNYNRNNEITLNLGFIKCSYTADNVRANVALMTGTYTSANLASEPEVLRNIFEANVGVRLSRKRNVWLDAGIMPSHIGFESAIGKDCPNLTRSILAENSPYYEAGVKLGYTSQNEKWSIAALLLNGWQRIKRIDGNTTPAIGTQVTYKPSSLVTLVSSTFVGNVKPDSVRQMRYFHNLYGTFQLSKKFSLITGFDIGTEQITKGSSQMHVWYSPVLIAKYKLTDKSTLAARGEYYQDRNEVIISTGTPNGFQTFGYSLNLDYSVTSNVLCRIEARALKSKDKIFENRNGSFSSNTTWLTTSVAIGF